MWEQRGQKRYYYRNSWQNGRSVRTYLGSGEIAEMAATADALQRVAREIESRKWQQEQERRAAAEALLTELCQQSDLLVRAALVAASFRQHHRGAWRRQHVKKSSDRDDGHPRR
jgi:hypothetical protein